MAGLDNLDAIYFSASLIRIISFHITPPSYILPFTKTNSCAYCGEPVEWQEYSSRYEKNGKYNLDRINNKQGYIKNNCVVCCGACNFLKGPRTKEEFLSRVDKIYSHQHKLLA